MRQSSGQTSTLPTARGSATRRSEDLQRAMARAGIGMDELLFRATAVIQEIQEAGQGATAKDAREELQIHLEYWQAVARLLSGSGELNPMLSGSGQGSETNSVREARGRQSRAKLDLLAAAQKLDGVSSLEVRKFTIDTPERIPRFGAANCRLIEGRIKGLQIGSMRLPDTSLLATELEVEIADALIADRAIVWRGHITVKAAGAVVVSFKAAAFRDTTLTIDVPNGSFDLDNADLAAQSFVSNELLLERVKDSLRKNVDAKAKVTLKVQARTSTFERASLQGAELIECKLPGANFAEASLQGTRLMGCELAGASFSGAKLDSETKFEECSFGDAGLAGATFAGTPTFVACTPERPAGLTNQGP